MSNIREGFPPQTPTDLDSGDLETQTRPTYARFLVVGMATLMAMLLYLDRFFLGYLIIFMREDFAMSDSTTGWVLNIFFLSYAAAQIPSGWLSDRFGPRTVLAFYILLWSVFTGLMGFAGTVFLLIALRFCFGLAQAGAYPTSANIVSKWISIYGRGTASSIVAFGGRVGGSIAPILTAYILLAFVPVSVPSELTKDDLLDPSRLLKEMQGTGKKEVKTVVDIIEKNMSIPLAKLQKKSPSEQAKELLAALNKTTLQSDLYDHVEFGAFKLEREAWSLSTIDKDKISKEQLTRRNRLLLQAVFPKWIRKVYGKGWRPVAFVYFFVGIVVAVLFWLGVRNRPQDHPLCNEAEQKWIERDRPPGYDPHGKVESLPIGYMLRCRSLWLSAISQFGTNCGWIFLPLLVPLYLTEAHNLPSIQVGWLASLPLGIGFIGMLCGGVLTDVLVRMMGLRWGRRLPMALTRFVAMAMYIACLFMNNPLLLTAAFCLVAVSTDLGTPATWAFKQDIGGKHVGSVLGFGNMVGNFGAFFMPWFLLSFPLFSGPYKWELRFLACAAAFAISGITAMGIDATKPVVPEVAES